MTDALATLEATAAKQVASFVKPKVRAIIYIASAAAIAAAAVAGYISPVEVQEITKIAAAILGVTASSIAVSHITPSPKRSKTPVPPVVKPTPSPIATVGTIPTPPAPPVQ